MHIHTYGIHVVRQFLRLRSIAMAITFTSFQHILLLMIPSVTVTAGDIWTIATLRDGYNLLAPDSIPDPKNVAEMSRFIVHIADWATVSYISHSGKSSGLPMSALFSVSDGPRENGTGVPYFYVSRLQAAVTDLMDNSSYMSILMSMAQTSICNLRHLDPEDPRCAHVVLTGQFEKIRNDSTEYTAASSAVFSRHPSLVHLPADHHFFLAKLNIQQITLQDMFGGPADVPVSDYFKVRNKRQNLTQYTINTSAPLLNPAINGVLLVSIMAGFIHLCT